jgi:hypothetical protein
LTLIKTFVRGRLNLRRRLPKGRSSDVQCLAANQGKRVRRHGDVGAWRNNHST